MNPPSDVSSPQNSAAEAFTGAIRTPFFLNFIV
jgi:hypothetical protein